MPYSTKLGEKNRASQKLFVAIAAFPSVILMGVQPGWPLILC